METESRIRRLAEVDFPIAAVSLHSAREKPVAYSHPKTLHLWWARRPLAACRAVLLSLLLPDPCDEKCPESFKAKARNLLASSHGNAGQQDLELRRLLLRFIADFSNWDVSTKPTFLNIARGLVNAAYSGEPPLVVDPFAGGGSIPLEAMRLGCETFASDLNPVAGLTLKCVIEDVPRYGDDLAEKFKSAVAEIEISAERELGTFFPLDPDGAQPIAYLWARTVRCEAPDCGAEIPLVRSWWLAKVRGVRKALGYKIVKSSGLKLEVFTPSNDRDVPKGTVSRAKAICPCCGRIVSAERVREQLRSQKGGAAVVFDNSGLRRGGARLLAVVCTTKNGSGRLYREPRLSDYEAVWKSYCRLMELSSSGRQIDTSPWPDEPLPPKGTLGFRIQNYGMSSWADLFSCRQKLALITISRLIKEWAESERGILPDLLAITASRLTDFNSSLSRWASNRQTSAATFGRQALPMLWDFCETSPLSGSTGSWRSSTRITLGCLKSQLWSYGYPGSVMLADACELPLPDDSAGIWFTDPPYYDAVPYADLSDFFYVWLKRMLPNHPMLRDPFEPTNPLTPKSREIVQDEAKQVNGLSKNRTFFEKRITSAFEEGRRVLRDDGIACVVFAHKTTEGWEALLSGLIQGGWIITGSWPIATERLARLRSQESAALATRCASHLSS
jgi:putative DNA methylase